MDQLLDPVRDFLDGQIDFQGQAFSETLYTVLLTAVGVISFLAGFFTKNVYNTLYVGLAGTALTFLVTVPHWPWFNKHPERWLPSQKYKGSVNVKGAVDVTGIDVSGIKVS